MLYVSNSLNDSNQKILNRGKKKSVLWFKQPIVQEKDGGMLDLEVIYRKRVKSGLQTLLVHSVIWPHMGKECSKRNNSPVLFSCSNHRRNVHFCKEYKDKSQLAHVQRKATRLETGILADNLEVAKPGKRKHRNCPQIF